MPVVTLLLGKPKGAVVSSPSLVAPWKNSTLATLPSSVAVALIVIWAAGDAKVAPLAGLVMLTAGGLFDEPLPLRIVKESPIAPVSRRNFASRRFPLMSRTIE